MSIIYSFLQKRKMHENHQSYVMVVIVYLVSGLLLALSSDSLYNINSKAADVNTEIEEGTREPLYASAPGDASTKISSFSDPEDSYEFDEEFIEDDDVTSNGDTVWMFGTEMNGETFDTLMEQTGVLVPKSKSSSTKAESKLSATYKTAYGSISESDVTMLQRIVQAEAGGEDAIGKILIANVVLNRMQSNRFPDTIKGVVTQHKGSSYQFSPVKSGRIWSVKISSSTKEAVNKALQGVDYSKGALYFISKDNLSASKAREFDTRLDWLFKHGGHDFYKRK